MIYFKIDDKGIGTYMISVPTNSTFGVGIGRDSALSTTFSYNGENLPKKITVGYADFDDNNYRYDVYQLSTTSEPFSKYYTATINGESGVVTSMDVCVNCYKSSIGCI